MREQRKTYCGVRDVSFGGRTQWEERERPQAVVGLEHDDLRTNRARSNGNSRGIPARLGSADFKTDESCTLRYLQRVRKNSECETKNRCEQLNALGLSWHPPNDNDRSRLPAARIRCLLPTLVVQWPKSDSCHLLQSVCTCAGELPRLRSRLSKDESRRRSS